MSSRLVCADNRGFEDLLTEGKAYEVIEWGLSGIKIEDDSGQERWYGVHKFIREDLYDKGFYE